MQITITIGRGCCLCKRARYTKGRGLLKICVNMKLNIIMQMAALLKHSLEQEMEYHNGDVTLAFRFPDNTKVKHKFQATDVTKVSS